jgi:hypothetical protein
MSRLRNGEKPPSGTGSLVSNLRLLRRGSLSAHKTCAMFQLAMIIDPPASMDLIRILKTVETVSHYHTKNSKNNRQVD